MITIDSNQINRIVNKCHRIVFNIVQIKTKRRLIYASLEMGQLARVNWFQNTYKLHALLYFCMECDIIWTWAIYGIIIILHIWRNEHDFYCLSSVWNGIYNIVVQCSYSTNKSTSIIIICQ